MPVHGYVDSRVTRGEPDWIDLGGVSDRWHSVAFENDKASLRSMDYFIEG